MEGLQGGGEPPQGRSQGRAPGVHAHWDRASLPSQSRRIGLPAGPSVVLSKSVPSVFLASLRRVHASPVRLGSRVDLDESKPASPIPLGCAQFGVGSVGQEAMRGSWHQKAHVELTQNILCSIALTAEDWK